MVVVMSNYLTATSLTRGFDLLFAHAIFWTLPFTGPMYWDRMMGKRRTTDEIDLPWMEVFACGLLIMFGLAWIPWFSSNPYEQYAIEERFFGAYGWIPWLSLMGVGVLPLVSSLGGQWIAKSAARAMAMLGLAIHGFNGYCVWLLCHPSA